MPMPTRLLGATVGLALTLTLTACGGDDEPDPIPGGAGTPTPEATVSPPPDDVPELSDEQQSAYDAAVARFTEFTEYSYRISQNPGSISQDKVVSELSFLTVMPETKAMADSYDNLIDAGIRFEGSTKIEWTVPVEVSADEVVFAQCESPGTRTAYQGDVVSPIAKNNLTTVTTVKVDDGTWRIKDAGDFEEC